MSIQQAVEQTVVIASAPGAERVLTPEALAFLGDLHGRFSYRRDHLLGLRRQRFELGQRPAFRDDTRGIRQAKWRVSAIPMALQDRRVEITGPVDRKMMIHALNSGAQVFMADFEDSHSPTWRATVQGQLNVQDAVHGRLRHEADGKTYEVRKDPALLVVRVRGLHLDEVHLEIGGRPVPAALFDFALSVFHNARQQVAEGVGPFFYLPKLETMEEAQWWDDVFTHAEQALGLDHGTIKATVLIETLPAAFQMDEILYALRDHVVGLNAGRWDYIFSCIKTLRHDRTRVLPDRDQVTMTAPFMRAYTRLLVATCHKRGAFAMGGMSAFIPDKHDAARSEAALAAVREDKRREAQDGFDGTWVAHPGLVATALGAFEEVLQERVNQCDRQLDVIVTSSDLLDFAIPGARCTLAGLRANIEVGIQYIDHWLAGRGAAAIHGLMEDAATAEISRGQVWQWVRHGVLLDDGSHVSQAFATDLIRATAARLGEGSDDPERTACAARLFEQVALADVFPAFLTVVAQPYLEDPQ